MVYEHVFVYHLAMAGRLRDAIEEVLKLDVSLLCDAAIREEFIELAACAELLELVRCRFAAAVDGRGIPDADGAATTASWIQLETGQVRRDAQFSVLVGHALGEFPEVEAAWESGAITASAARMIVNGRCPGAEREYAELQPVLVGFAVERDYWSLRRTVAHYRNRADQLRLPVEPEGLYLSEVGGTYALRGTLDLATGEYLAKAIDAASMAPSPDDPRTPAQRRADALGLVAKTFCDAGDGPREHTNAAHVLAVVDWGTLVDSVPLATVGLDGQPITRAFLDRLLCESSITRVVTGPSGEILDVGRARRTPSRAQRQAVIARDQHCRFPGCDRPAGWSEIHHVQPWQHGGPTELGNLVLLCSRHHQVVHRPGWTVKFDGSELTVITPGGFERSTRPPERPPSPPPRVAR